MRDEIKGIIRQKVKDLQWKWKLSAITNQLENIARQDKGVKLESESRQLWQMKLMA